MRRLLRTIGLTLAACVILFEEWLWDPLKRAMLVFGQLPLVRQLGQVLSGLSPRWALAIYLLPMAILFPFKLAGLWLIGSGHAVLGVLTFLAAKITGTALFAWLFALTRPALLQVAWFARAYGWVQAISAIARDWIRHQAIYRWTRATLRRLRARLGKLFSASGQP